MARKRLDPESPEVIEAILDRIRAMTREEWIRELSWRPEGAVETYRTRQHSDVEASDTPEVPPKERARP
jgi:hypothetical protein